MLHVGSAIGLLIYFWRDWIAIIRAFFATLGKRRIETPTERLAWLIVVRHDPGRDPRRRARAPDPRRAGQAAVGGHLPDRQRLHPARAERYRRRAEVRELARREGLNPEGARRLDTLEYKRGGGDRRRPVLGADRRDQPRRRGHDRRPGPRARQRRRRALRLPAGHAADPRRRPLQVRATSPARSATGSAARPSIAAVFAAITAVDHRPLPHPLLQAPQPAPVRDLLHPVRALHGRVHAIVGTP